MNLQKFKREDPMVDSKESYVSIRSDTITFNAAFVNQAKLGSCSRVTVFLDPGERVVGFRFHSDENDPDAYKLLSSASRTPLNIRVRKIMKVHKWIGEIAKFDGSALKRFKPEYRADGDMWLIHLCPAFENKVSSASGIPSDTKGVYRYLLDNKIVYIGKGIVRSRASVPERADWDFDIIEYSVIEDTEKQDHWETFFLDRFVEENGNLPLHNKILGKKQKSD